MCKYVCVHTDYIYVRMCVQACTCTYTEMHVYVELCGQGQVMLTWSSSTDLVCPLFMAGRAHTDPDATCYPMKAQQISISPAQLRVLKSAGRGHFSEGQFFCRKITDLAWLKVIVKGRFLLKNESASFCCFRSAVSITYSKTMFHYCI